METKEVYDVFHVFPWDWRIPFDLFLGGLGVGAFLCAIALMFYKKNDQLVAVKIGAVLGPVAMAVGLLVMLSDLAQPFRIYKTVVRLNTSSTFSWGGIFQEGFIVFSAIFAVLLLTERSKAFRQKMAVFAGFFALFVAGYHGFLLSFVTARPLWNAGAVNVASVFASINAGIAAVVLLTFLSKKGREEMRELNRTLRDLLLVSLLIQLSTCLIWIVTLIHGKADFVNAYHVMNQQFGLLFWIGAIIIGMVFPFAVLAVYCTGKRKDQAIPVIVICLPILVGCYIFRHVLIMAGQIS